MRTSAFCLARRHALEAAAKPPIASRRMISSQPFPGSGGRNLSSIVPAARFETNAIKPFPVAKSRKSINGSIKLSVKKRVAKSPKKKVDSPQRQIETEERMIVEELASQESPPAEKLHTSPSHLTYTGGKTMPLTSVLRIVKPGEDAPRGTWPVFRVMDENGEFRDPGFDGYKDPDNVGIKTSCKEPPSTDSGGDDHSKQHDLASLRSVLLSEYPAHASEIMESLLLQNSPCPFPDTGTDNTLLRAQRQMVRLRQMDNIMQNAQRQGRISFYMTCRGEEAIHIGSASALKPDDVVLAQYREAGILMWRGFTLEQFTNQCFSNDADLGRGRQMPVHYGSRALNYHTISSPLGTQIPQATGAAYKLKLDAANDENSEGSIAICYFGDGCASTTDFHSGLNFAATLKTPIIFFCRNNGYAISTSVEDQYAGDGIISRAPGYGMAGIRVDGNDIFAVNAAVRAARSYCLENSAPILIEAMTYRQGHHSTSDDSTRYRSAKEVHGHTESTDPIKRLNTFMDRHGWMDPNAAAKIRDEERMAVLNAMEAAERRPPPKLDMLFQDVYHDIPDHLKRQEQQLHEHMAKYPGRY